MKNTLLLFILCSLSAQAQTITKNFVLAPDGINYFEVVRETNEITGTYSESATIIGKVADIASLEADKVEAQVKVLSEQAFAVSRTIGVLNRIASVDASIFTLTALSPLKTIQAKYASSLTANGWVIDQGAGAGFVPLVFTINASNNLRYSIAGAATKAATIYGDVITLSGYPSTGINTDFYLSENGRNYFSLPNRSVVIKKP
jgi:hypothetical protein